MTCKECRDILFSHAERSVETAGETTENHYLVEILPEAVREEVKMHISGCGACAALAEALNMSMAEGALHVDISEDETERITAGVMERVYSEAGPEVPDWEYARSAQERESQEPESEGRVVSFPRLGGLGRAAGFAAAALFLVVLSVSLTLVVTERRFPRGGSSIADADNAGGSVTESAAEDPAEPRAEEPNEAAESGGRTVTVHLSLEAPRAERVAVVGDWNGWNPEKHVMKDSNGDGVWELTLTVEEGGEYQYQFLINGKKWIPDPNAPLKVKDGFGGTNSILNI